MKRFLLTTCLAALTVLPVALHAQTQAPAAGTAGAPAAGVAPAGGRRGGGGGQQTFPKQTVEGQPIDTRAPEKADDHPMFPGQNHAPYHKSVDVKVTTLAEGFDNPFAVAVLPDGKFLITEKPGRLRILNKDGAPYETITDFPPIFYRGQVGLLDVVLDAKYAGNKRIFFSFMEKHDADNSAIAVASATLNETKAELKNTKVIYHTAPYPNRHADNAGGRIAISLKDGSLFVILGDRSRSQEAPWLNAQQLDSALGKLIHITADGKPAAGNPKLGGLPEIYTLGHRSEQGLAFAPDGRLWEVEDGPRGGDELNLIKAGVNYGWPIITHAINYSGKPIGDGIVEKAGMEQSRYYWDPTIAPSGMVFYKGGLFPQWKNSVLIGALRGQMLDRLTMDKDDKVVSEEPLLLDVNARIRDVRLDKAGAVYVLTDGPAAKLLKLTPR